MIQRVHSNNQKSKTIFCYMIIDKMYTFIHKKRKRIYVWTAIAIAQTGKYFYFYHLPHNKGSEALFNFNDDLPNVSKIYTDGHYSYNALIGDKATMQK